MIIFLIIDPGVITLAWHYIYTLLFSPKQSLLYGVLTVNIFSSQDLEKLAAEATFVATFAATFAGISWLLVV